MTVIESQGSRVRAGLVSQWSAPLCRLPVGADIRVLGRNMIVTGSLLTAFGRN